MTEQNVEATPVVGNQEPAGYDVEARQADVDAANENAVADNQSFVSPQRRLLNGPYTSADGGDANIGWTVQHGGAAPLNLAENRPGQVFTVDQLPDPEVARAAGLPPQRISPEFVVSAEEAYTHPSGPNVGEIERAAQRQAISDKLFEDSQVVAESDKFANENRVSSEVNKDDEARRVEAANTSSLDGGNNEGTAGQNGQPAPGREDSTATGDKSAK